MRKVFYLSTCSTCIRILKDLNLPKEVELHDLKNNPIDEYSLSQLFKKTGSYEMLFSKNAKKFQEIKGNLTFSNDSDYKSLILQEYTFLKRPVIVLDDLISIGNNQESLKELRIHILSL